MYTFKRRGDGNLISWYNTYVAMKMAVLTFLTDRLLTGFSEPKCYASKKNNNTALTKIHHDGVLILGSPLAEL